MESFASDSGVRVDSCVTGGLIVGLYRCISWQRWIVSRPNYLVRFPPNLSFSLFLFLFLLFFHLKPETLKPEESKNPN